MGVAITPLRTLWYKNNIGNRFRGLKIILLDTHHDVSGLNIFLNPMLAHRRSRSTFMPGIRIMAAT